ECQVAGTPAIHLLCVFLLIFFIEPPTFIRELKPAEVVKGFDAMLECEVSGTPPFEVTWLKNNKEIRSNFTASVHILNLEASDTGEYQCKAMNEVGSDTCVCAVKFKGLYKGADAPEPMSVTAGNSFTLECTVGGTPE
uniref:Ig-like domain-containing protein n=1 Tax=Terrapene triunguis TaxID=2587831 RepID=A0A674JWE2_9SAUR